jgi:hypothetical protein
MKALKIETEKYEFKMDDYGLFRMDSKGELCPEESGFCGSIHSQSDRVALARFLAEVSIALATPKNGKLKDIL